MPPKKISGQMTQYEMPNWDLLLKLLAVYLVADFMWMHEVELEDGTRSTLTRTEKPGATFT